MEQYHVGCSVSRGRAGIYAGTMKSNDTEWKNKSLVTDEVMVAVMQYLYMKIPYGEKKFSLKVVEGVTLDLNISWNKGEKYQ